MTPDAYKGIRKVTTAGVTLAEGFFTGFLNGPTAQEIIVGGPLVYDQTGTRFVSDIPTGTGITLQVGANAYVPIKCTVLKPAAAGGQIIAYIG